jgi:hypothetical protein
MTGKRQLTKSLNALDTLKQNNPVEFPGILGVQFKGQSLVDVPNREGYVYVRLRSNLNEIVQAYNSMVSPVFGLPVILVRDTTHNRYIIKGRDLGHYDNWGSSAYIPRHGAQHSFPDGNWGGDIVWVYDRQYVPLSVSPVSGSSSTSVYINPDTYYWAGSWFYAGNVITPDLTTYNPTTGTVARLVLVYLDGSGDVQITPGVYFSEIYSSMSDIIPYIPALPVGAAMPLGAVRLTSGTSSVSWSNIYDLRPIVGGDIDATITTGSSGHVIQDEGTPLANRANLNFMGSSVWAVDDPGNNATNIIISGSAGGGGAGLSRYSFPIEHYYTHTGSTYYITEINALDGIPDTDWEILQQFPIPASGNVEVYLFIDTASGGTQQLVGWDIQFFHHNSNTNYYSRSSNARVTGSAVYDDYILITDEYPVAVTEGDMIWLPMSHNLEGSAEAAYIHGIVLAYDAPISGGNGGSFSQTGTVVFNENGYASWDFRVESDTEENIIFVDSSEDKVYFGGTTNGVEIDKGGELTLLGTATVWEDLRVPMTSTKLGGTKDPGFTVFKTTGGSQGAFLYWFDNGTEEELYFACQIPHSYKQGSDIYPHIHWIPSSTGTSGQKVSWGLEYTWSNVGSIFGNTNIIYANVTFPADATLIASKHYMTALPTISGSGKTISSMLVCRLFRDATGAGATDSYAADAGLLEIDFHFELDTMGSKTETAK